MLEVLVPTHEMQEQGVPVSSMHSFTFICVHLFVCVCVCVWCTDVIKNGSSMWQRLPNQLWFTAH